MEQDKKSQLPSRNEEAGLMKLNGKLPWLQVWTSTEVSAQEVASVIVKIQSPQLHELGMNKAGKDLEGFLLFYAQIIALVKFLGADWDKDMAKEAAQLAYQEANWMTVAEVKFFITRIKCGKYTSHKNFTPGIFMEHLNDFIHEVLATRGAVNSYAWRDNKVPDEDYQLPLHPATGEPGREIDPELLSKTLKNITKMFQEAERRHRENDEKIRKAKWEALKKQRDQQIIDLVELDASQGIAPDKYMMNRYFEALGK